MSYLPDEIGKALARREQAIDAQAREAKRAGAAEKSEWLEMGRTRGRREGLREGRREGYEQGLQEGRRAGHKQAREAGRSTGRHEGRLEANTWWWEIMKSAPTEIGPQAWDKLASLIAAKFAAAPLDSGDPDQQASAEAWLRQAEIEVADWKAWLRTELASGGRPEPGAEETGDPAP